MHTLKYLVQQTRTGQMYWFAQKNSKEGIDEYLGIRSENHTPLIYASIIRIAFSIRIGFFDVEHKVLQYECNSSNILNKYYIHKFLKAIEWSQGQSMQKKIENTMKDLLQ